jgi:tRNA dimethylallyltransferase
MSDITNKPKVIIIAGPTASGKTEISIELAEKFRGEIVSADSVQIYRRMDIGSAKPTAAERARAVHHMIDIREPDEDFSAGDYVREARKCIEKIIRRGRLPIIVGGTGLYIRCLIGGMLDSSKSDRRLRRELLSEAERKGSEALFRRLVEVDPETARHIPSGNIYRIIRALEVFELSGRKMSDLQQEHAFQDRPYSYIFFGLAPARSRLYEQIDQRVDNMIKSGLVEEVTRLQKLGYSADLKSMSSLGYRHVGMALAGAMDVDEAIRLMKRDTRRYAKRQLTWFRSEPDIVWCDPHEMKRIQLIVDDFLGN